MRIDVSIADTVVGWIGFITLSPCTSRGCRCILSWQTPSHIYERWALVDMDSFELSAEEPTPKSYQNRPGHELVRHP